MSNKEPVGGTISKSVGPHYTTYMKRLIESGRYLTVAEILREALRLHEQAQEKAGQHNA
jgi:putative addiction module CopG family antidote